MTVNALDVSCSSCEAARGVQCTPRGDYAGERIPHAVRDIHAGGTGYGFLERKPRPPRAPSSPRRTRKRSSRGWIHPIDFCDVAKLLAALKKLPVFRDTPHSVRNVKLDLGRGRGEWCSGRAFLRQHRLRLVVGESANGAQVAEVLLHELVHLALPSGVAHSSRFRLTLARAAREAWGIAVDPSPAPHAPSPTRPRGWISAYVLDGLIQADLLALLASGSVVLPMLPYRSERKIALAKLVEKRAEHAVRMLVTAERRLKLARSLERKWKQKVSYYERSAAKKGGSS